MRLRHFALVLGLAPAMLLAATEFENGLVPMDLVQQFTGGTAYRSLPDGFPVVSLPAGTDVRVVGSLKQGSTLQALLGTSQNVDTLRATLVAAYVAAGWVDFTPANTTSSILCHDEAGSLLISRAMSGFNGLRLLNYRSSRYPGDATCAEQADPNAETWTTYFLDLMPVLTVPPQTTTPAGLISPYTSMSGSYSAGGTSIEMERDGLIDVPDINTAGLYSHFAARLAEQGWQNDTQDSTTVSATSVWYATVPPPDFAEADVGDTELTGVLTLLHLGEERYRVAFSLYIESDVVLTPGSYVGVRDFVPLGPPLNEPTLGIRGIPSGYTGSGGLRLFVP
jgi:hypothetical protein